MLEHRFGSYQSWVGFCSTRLLQWLLLLVPPGPGFAGPALRGANLAKYVLVQAADGYRAVFALPELDPEFARTVVLLAYEANGKPLAAGEGPYRVVVPADRKHARWVREVTAVKVLISNAN